MRPLDMTSGADAVTWPKNMGKDGDYVLLAAGGNPEANFPGAQDMVKRHQEKFGKAAAGAALLYIFQGAWLPVYRKTAGLLLQRLKRKRARQFPLHPKRA